jgi:hypothetical protein
MQKLTQIQLLLVISFLIETVCVTYAISFPQWVPIASVIYFIAGITIGLLFLRLPQSRLSFTIPSKSIQTGIGYKLFFALIIAIIMHHFTKNWIIDTPLTIYDADMLPVMKVMSQRFLQGQWSGVYTPIPEIWGGIQPIYLPAMWLPFTIAVAGNFDLRWITTGGLLLSFCIFLIVFTPPKKQIISILLVLTACMLFWWLQTEEVHNFIRLSEEGVVVCYFSLLTVALLSGNYYAIGLSAALCALSRYSLVGWLPAMLFYLLFIKKNKKELFAFVSTGLGVFVLLVILPFGWKILQVFLSLPSQYIEHANRVWKDSPELFRESMGFAKFFSPLKTGLLHRVLITAAFGVPLLFITGCYAWQKTKKRILPNMPLACLKISLVVFYSLLDVPYLYLFYTSSFVSLIAIAYFMQKNTNENPVIG